MTTPRVRVLAAVAMLPLLACGGTTYMPRADGRISFTSSGTALYLTKNGRRFEPGLDALEQAVAGNPAAEEHARQRTRDLHTGLVLDFGGLAAVLGGAFVVAPSRNADGTTREVSAARGAVGGALMIGGLAAICGAISYLSSAQSHQWDAINVYNDSAVPPPGPFVPPGFAPPPPFAPPLYAPPPAFAPSAPNPSPSAAPPSFAPPPSAPPSAAPPRNAPPPAVSPPAPPIYQAPPAPPVYQAPPASPSPSPVAPRP